jgi:hypothetical protein
MARMARGLSAGLLATGKLAEDSAALCAVRSADDGCHRMAIAYAQ